MNPLVSVICVCYNHARFVRQAIESVLQQSYSPVELIVVDDASQDGSAQIINQLTRAHPEIRFISLKKNHGYCKAFNQAFPMAGGSFIIDLAADDILLPERIKCGVDFFITHDKRYGVQFSDAEYIDEAGIVIRKHSLKFPHHVIPQGDVYSAVIGKYFICSPTMMIRKQVLEEMGGYDEGLAYEDFDLWVRAARNHYFGYLPDVLVQKRILPNALGRNQYAFRSKQLRSTYTVCTKILKLNKGVHDRRALNVRIGYELKWVLVMQKYWLGLEYLLLWLRNNWRK